MKSLQIWVFIRIISAKSTPAWQTPHPLIWSKRDKKKKKNRGWTGSRLMWDQSSSHMSHTARRASWAGGNMHRALLQSAPSSCISRLPAPVPALLCALCHHSKKNKKCYPAVSICICSRSCTHTHRHTHHTCRSHNTPRCISRSCHQPHTHTQSIVSNSIVSSPFQNSEHIRAHCYGCLFPSANAGRFRGAEWHPNVG